MHANDGVVNVFDVIEEVADQLGELVGHGVADGVGDVDGRGTRFDGGLGDLGEEFGLGARGILGAELDVLGQGSRVADALDGEAQDFALRLLEFVFEMQLRRG